VPTDDKGIAPDVHLPAILQGYSRSNLLVGMAHMFRLSGCIVCNCTQHNL
jgi:hypothetical protein